MKISKIRYGNYSKVKKMKRFNMGAKPLKQRFYLKPITKLLAFPDAKKYNLKITRVNMEGLKPPYLLLASHHSFMDFKVMTKVIYPTIGNYVIAVDAFQNIHWLVRHVGGIYKRKFTSNDLYLIKNMIYAKKHKSAIVMFPEARYSIIGTTAVLPESLGKFCKLIDIPVVVLNMHGNYLQQPVWNLTKRMLPLSCEITQIINKDEIKSLPNDEILNRIEKALVYDEWKWQKENNIHIDFEDRAKGLHKVLYQCPHCKVESKMDSDKNKLFCTACKKEWEMDTLGQLKATSGETEFSHVPDWYEWIRSQVKKQIFDGTYKVKAEVWVDSLPNHKGFWRLGKAKLTHDMNGFKVQGDFDEPFLLEKKPLANYSVHIEYEYHGKGDCVILSKIDDTYYLFPINQPNIITKMNLGAEELYNYTKAKIAEEKRTKK